jgi:hypothetical protein
MIAEQLGSTAQNSCRKLLRRHPARHHNRKPGAAALWLKLLPKEPQLPSSVSQPENRRSRRVVDLKSVNTRRKTRRDNE